MTSSTPTSAAQISLGWLNSCLFNEGDLSNAEVIDFEVSIVGDGVGFLGDLCRLKPTYRSPSGFPETLILKFPTAFESGKETGKVLGAYQREADFYRFNDNSVKWCQPPAHYYSEQTGQDEFLVVMEDLADHRFVAQADGLNHQDAENIMIALARFHAAYWQAPKLEEMSWLRPFSDYAKIYPPQIESGWPLLKGNFPYAIREDYEEIYPLANELYPDICNQLQTCPRTMLHGDARMENVAFDPTKTGPESVRFYDWQLCCKGPAAYDVMYFLYMSINVEDWPLIGEQLISLYSAELASYGVADYSEKQLREDLSLAACLMFGFVSMVGNILPDNEAGHTVMKATLPRAYNLYEALDVKSAMAQFTRSQAT